MTDEIPNRLLNCACELFLGNDFHSVSIRKLAEHAGTSSGMIKYYFNNKQGLFEAMIKREYGRILDILHGVIMQEELLDFTHIINQVMSIYEANPNMPKFIAKTYLLRQGPGSHFLQEMFEYEQHTIKNWVVQVIKDGKIDRDTDAEVVRMAFMSITLLPGMMQDTLKHSYGDEGYQEFRQNYAKFTGEMILNAVKPQSSSKPISKDKHKSKSQN
jgi:AcrR family transcriptional regulator